MVYKKKASELREKQTPLRQRIKDHIQVVTESIERIYTVATERVQEVQGTIAQLKADSEKKRRQIAELRTEAFGADDQEGEDEGGDEEEDEDELKMSLREAARKQEENDSNIIQMQRDLETVRRTLQRLETKLQRRGPGMATIPLPKIPSQQQPGKEKKQ
jgi:chromosome segregation ATPase